MNDGNALPDFGDLTFDGKNQNNEKKDKFLIAALQRPDLPASQIADHFGLKSGSYPSLNDLKRAFELAYQMPGRVKILFGRPAKIVFTDQEEAT